MHGLIPLFIWGGMIFYAIRGIYRRIRGEGGGRSYGGGGENESRNMTMGVHSLSVGGATYVFPTKEEYKMAKRLISDPNYQHYEDALYDNGIRFETW